MEEKKNTFLQEQKETLEDLNTQGKKEKLIAFRVSPEILKKISALGVATGKSRKALLTEACIDLYKKHYDEVKEYFNF